jgi:dipeptide/tripeptide permease
MVGSTRHQDDGYALAPEDPNPPRRRSTLLSVCPFILGNEFCERLAFYGLSTNMVMYLTRVMGEDSGFAAVQLNLFEGTCYLTPILGAWLADSLWGRYFTILVFSVIYFIGMIMLTLSASIPGLTPPLDKYPTHLQSAALYLSLYVVALGTGGIKPNVSAFGADQFDEADPQDRREKTSFFNWFYFSINLGSLLAVTVIVWIQENISWAVGFAVPAVCMALAVMVFIAGSGRYKHVEPSESPFSRVFKITWAAIQSRRRAAVAAASHLPDGETTLQGSRSNRSSSPSNGQRVRFEPMPTIYSMGRGESESYSALTEPFLPPGGTTDALNHQSGYGLGDGNNNTSSSTGGALGNTILEDGTSSGAARKASLGWMDSALESRSPGGALRFTRQQVEEVKLVIRMLPIFFPTILYWTIYVQMGSFFVVQGAHMDRTMVLPKGLGTFEIPAASLSMINTLAIVGLIPCYDKLLAPALRRAGRPLTLLKRIGWGLVVCLLAMLCASYVEWYRLKLFNEGHVIRTTTGDGDDGSSSGNGTVVDMSVWWQVPQYLLIGLSEVFTSIGQMEFFYDQAPDVMRSCSMALQLLSVAVGSYLSGAVVWGTQLVTSKIDPFGFGWLPKDINKGRLDLFFLVLGGLMVINIMHFVSVALKYEYKAVEHIKRVAPRRLPSSGPGGGPAPRPRTAPMPSTAPSAAHPATARRIQGAADSPAPQPYGRSVTFLPQTPAMPAPFR